MSERLYPSECPCCGLYVKQVMGLRSPTKGPSGEFDLVAIRYQCSYCCACYCWRYDTNEVSGLESHLPRGPLGNRIPKTHVDGTCKTWQDNLPTCKICKGEIRSRLQLAYTEYAEDVRHKDCLLLP